MIFDVIIPVYKPDEKLDLLIKALLGQVVRPRSILCLLTRVGINANSRVGASSASAKVGTGANSRVGASSASAKVGVNSKKVAASSNLRVGASSASAKVGVNSNLRVGASSASEIPEFEGPDEELARRLTEKDERIKVHFVDQKDYDHAGTRNLGIRLTGTDAEYFLLMTQDAVPAGNHLTEELLKSFEDETVAAAYARQLSDKFTPIPEKCARRFNYPAESEKKTIEDLPRLGIKTYFCSNVCAMYRRDVFEKLGGFEAPAIFNEDMVYASTVLRNGYSIFYNAEAQVVHWHTYNLKQQFRRSFDNGASEAIRADVFDGVAPAKEGKRYVKETIRTLRRVRQIGRIPYFILQCGFRYLGFSFGKRYRMFPKSIRRAFSLNRSFWDDWDKEQKHSSTSR